MTTIRVIAAAAAGLLLAGSVLVAGEPPSKLPPGHPAIGNREPFQIHPPPPGAGRGAHGLVWTVPPGWIAEPPANPMRRAQYRIPGKAGDAHCVVFYFGPGQGGEPMANARRWAGQFQPEDGRGGPAELKTTMRRVGAIEVLLVEVHGRYVGGPMAGGAAPQPHSMLLGAIARGPDANWFFKLTGPEATVAGARGAFLALVDSLRPGTDEPRRPA